MAWADEACAGYLVISLLTIMLLGAEQPYTEDPAALLEELAAENPLIFVALPLFILIGMNSSKRL
ncbi:MAG: hypothetical protein JSW55_13925 [Chloroflexota bacterium]|nr:MAG: hypothetical protein JSW55_13925 [Chloroflexota bacterium]